MAKVARQWLVWHGSPKLDELGNPARNEMGDVMYERIEVAMDHVVPDSVPTEVLEELEARDLIFEDPTKEHISKQEGPPRVMLPPIMTQKLDHARKIAGMRGGIPPRPANPHSSMDV